MRIFDWLRGTPRDTQRERAEARRAEATDPAHEAAAADRTPDEIETAAAVRRDEEAIRHSGI